LHIAAEKGHAAMCELLLENGGELKILDVARRSAEMLARRNEHYDVLAIIAKYHEANADDDAPLLVFKPFAGVINTATPPEGSNEIELKPGEFKLEMQ
jgi:ankyrin repeat protein